MNFEHLPWRKSSYSQDGACVELAPLPWRKSSRSSSANCVELAPTANRVAARDSKNPAQPILAVAPTTWASFATATRTGRFDLG